MEDELDESISELFVQEMVDPRIESAMPILSRLKKPVTEMEEVDTLAEWADGIINEKLDLEEGDVIPFKKKKQDDDDLDDDWIPSIEDFEQEEKHRNRKRTPANDVNEMDKSPEANPYHGWGHSKSEVSKGPDKTAKMMAAKQAVKAARKTLDKAFKGDVDENFISMAPQAVAEGHDDGYQSGIRAYNDGMPLDHNPYADDPDMWNSPEAEAWDKGWKYAAGGDDSEEEVEEGLDTNQKRVGQLGPTEKVKNNNIGKLVGANESKEIPEELARIMEMVRFKK
jgi:hypothetical protein